MSVAMAAAEYSEYPDDLRQHPAYQAWRRQHAKARKPTRIELVQSKPNLVVVFRLYGIGPGESPLIAKWVDRKSGGIERSIYEQALPYLPVSAPRYYGFVEEDQDRCWLFLEDVGTVAFSPSNSEHRAAATRWIALMHTMAADLLTAQDFPDRGPNHYLRQLQKGRNEISESFHNPDLTPDDTDFLRAVMMLCDQIEAHWNVVLNFCREIPQTLVHGDFRPKNVRIRHNGDDVGVFPLDWEMAGWGVPAADLAPNRRHVPPNQVNLSDYSRQVSERWTNFSNGFVRQLASVGHLFRLLASIDWASQGLSFPKPAKSLAQLRVYYPELSQVFREKNWS